MKGLRTMFKAFKNETDKTPIGLVPSLDNNNKAIGCKALFDTMKNINCLVLLDNNGDSLHAFYRSDFK